MELSPRERILALVAALILVPLLAFRFALLPLWNQEDNLRRQLAEGEQNLTQLHLLGQEHLYYGSSRPSQGLPLDQRVKNLLRGQGLAERAEINSGESQQGQQQLSIKLDEMTLGELARLIHQIENARPQVVIENFSLSPSFKGEGLLRLSLSLIEVGG